MVIFQSRWLRTGEVWFDEEPTNLRVDVVRYLHRTRTVSGTQCSIVYTIVIDLSGDSEELLAGMTKDTRYEIRRATNKNGVVYEFWHQNSADALGRFCEFYDRFASGKGIALVPRSRLSVFADAGALDLSCVADGEGNELVWHAYYRGERRVRLLHSGSLFREATDRAARNLVGRANRYHHWQDMLRFKEGGIRTYDFGGWYAGEAHEDYLRVNRFKEEFGGTVEQNYNCVRLATIKARLVYAVGKLMRRRR